MSTCYLGDLAPEAAAEAFARHGWNSLELSNEHGAALLERGDPERAGEGFRRFCEGIGLRLPQGHLKLTADIARPDAEALRRELDELKAWLDLFAALGIRAAVLHPGGASRATPGREPGEALRTMGASLAELTAHASGGPTVICLENGGTAGELLRIIEAAGGRGLGICFDTGHLALSRARNEQGARSEREFIVEAGQRLAALHLADNDGSADQHLLPFDGGLVDWGGVAKGLTEIGYDGLFNFEILREGERSLADRLHGLSRIAELTERMMAGVGGGAGG